MLKETVEIKVDYEKAGVSSEGCAPVLDCYYNTLTEDCLLYTSDAADE